MTEQEFTTAIHEAQRHIEDALIRLATLQNKDGLAIAAPDPRKVTTWFDLEVERLRADYMYGSVQIGMKVANG